MKMMNQHTLWSEKSSVKQVVNTQNTETENLIKQPFRNHVEHTSDTKIPSSPSNMKNNRSKPEHNSEAKKKELEINPIKIEESLKSRNLVIPDNSANDSDAEDEKIERMARILAQKYFWSSIAAASFILGVGCLVLSRGYKYGNRSHRWSKI